MKKRALHILFIALLAADCTFGQTLKVVTMNIWTGLDYIGYRRIGEYEPQAIRDQRSRMLIKELKSNLADVIALQEVNPVQSLGPAIADELGYDCIYERANAGLKIGRIGFPTNLNEGLVILARKSLRLEFVDVWDLSDGFGLFGNAASLHWTERRLGLVGRIRIGTAEVYVVNVHISSVVPDDSSARYVARHIASSRTQDEQEIRQIVQELFSDADSRMRSVELMLRQLNGPYADKPCIVLGDFNAGSSQPEIRRLRTGSNLLDASEIAGIGSSLTWDPERNTNIRYSVQPVDASGDSLTPAGLLSAWYDGRPRTIDHIFLNRSWKVSDVEGAHIVLDKPENGLFASDHYGVLAALNVSNVVKSAVTNPDEVPESAEKELEGLPILSYDTDTGLGYGVKGFLLNYLGAEESFDVIAFNSSKGERWYRMVFSVPDLELRQGKVYPLSFDLTVDYDKYLKNNFYGVGNQSHEADRETYSKEPVEILGVLSRGFTREFVAQLGLKYRTVRNFGYEQSSLFARSLSSINKGTSSALTMTGSMRYDSRDSFVNPSKGQVAEVALETGGSWLMGDYSLTSTTLALQTYHVLFYPKTVFAAKLWGQAVGGNNLPIHVLATAGGNRTLRGFPQDRFLDKAAMGANAEIRFPIYWRLGGLLGIDAARVFSSPASITLADWVYNPVVGLRFYMDTFVVRADIGFGSEATGFYLNFGQLF
ncbi:MAG: BamA/TamA family outer membrane protein [Ignavibacteriales bacterium]|nr:BamA/TamA family outer membrane protein [Ignavibacteriales bacterium]